MYKKFKDYDFREIVGHFVLMKNTNVIKEPNKYHNIDESVERIKKLIVEDTKNYYKNKLEYNIEDDIEEGINIDSLNEEMTTRTVDDLYEPIYGYVTIEKKRGLLVYLLGNEEDRMKYVYALTYLSFKTEDIDNIEMEIIDDIDYPHAIEFKEQIKDDEELDEEVIKTRNLKDLDIFRLKFSPDFVHCMVSYNNIIYPAKVKLTRHENQNIYATYHKQEGLLKLIVKDKAFVLFFKPKEPINNKKALNEYVMDIMQGLEKDFELEKNDIIEIAKIFQPTIEEGYIEGDLPFETIMKIWDEIEEE